MRLCDPGRVCSGLIGQDLHLSGIAQEARQPDVRNSLGPGNLCDDLCHANKARSCDCAVTDSLIGFQYSYIADSCFRLLLAGMLRYSLGRVDESKRSGSDQNLPSPSSSP